MNESQETNRNGKKSSTTSPLFASNNIKQQGSDDLTSETSEEDEKGEFRVERR